MIHIRPSVDRGFFDHGWLKTFHSFSFGDYRDERYMGYRFLRVINEDKIAKGEGFGTHGHQNMEIITFVISGELAHKDSMGNGSSIRPGEFQYMSAGKGVTHSEFNYSQTDETHLFQLWILPNKVNTEPRYTQVHVDHLAKLNQLAWVVGPDQSGAPIEVYQKANMYVSLLEANQKLTFDSKQEMPYLYVQILSGIVSLNNHELKAGDAMALSQESKLEINSREDAQFLLFEMA